MNPILRNILAVIAGIIVELFINGTLVSVGGHFLPIPEGVDPNDIESIKANIHLYSTKHFIAPFLAHAIGTLVGAFVACKIAVSSHKMLALVVAGFHFLGGLGMSFLLGFEPLSLTLIDLIFAYFPMAILAWKFAHPLKFAASKENDANIIDGNI